MSALHHDLVVDNLIAKPQRQDLESEGAA